jgi:DNA-binding SARP family transcriptional activator
MRLLRVSLFGCIRIIRDQNPADNKLTHSTQGLLAYLILFRQRTHQREVLAEIFWGNKDPDRSRCSLNTALWQLRNILEPSGISHGTYLINDHHNEIGFNGLGPFWLDVQVFDECIGRVLQSRTQLPCDDDLQKLENAITLYRGELLEGFYDDWALREREHLRERYLTALAYLMVHYHHQADFAKSLAYGQKILEIDPLREEIHRQMMKIYLEAGQRAQAVRQYEICKDVLARELHIEPMQETRNLYDLLLSQKIDILSRSKTETPHNLVEVLSYLHQAQAAYEQARANLDIAKQVVESMLKSHVEK